MRVRPRVVVLSLLGLVVVGALLLLYSRELFGGRRLAVVSKGSGFLGVAGVAGLVVQHVFALR